MIINREVLNSKPVREERCTDIDLFEYTLETASIMNNDIILFTESIGGKGKKIIDFGAIINAIIEGLINAIKKIFRKFFAFLAELASIGSSFEIELRSFKDKIKALDKSVNIDFPYYEFTNLDEGFPPFDIYDKITKLVTPTNLQSEFALEDKRNTFRAMLLKNKESKDSDYAVTLFNFFRNGGTPNSNLTIPGNIIYDKFYTPYIDARKELSKIKKEEDNVEKNIRQIKMKIKKEISSSKFNTEDSTKSIELQRQVCTCLDLISQDLLIFYGQKLQAYKDYKLQSRKVLVCAIKACIVD